MAHHFQTASAITINGTANGELAGFRNGCEGSSSSSSSGNSSTGGGAKVLSKAAAAKFTKGSSLATLCNIGNSCYMNSVLYTLRLAPNFTHNLHHLIEFCNLALPRRPLEQSVFSLDSLTSHATPAPQQQQQQQQQLGAQHKPKSSSLGRNIPGLHVANGRSWSSKDLASLGATCNNSGSANIGSGGSSTVALAANGSSSSSSGEANNHANGGNDLHLGSASTKAVSVGLISNNNNNNEDGGCAQQQQQSVGGAAGTKSSSLVVCETLHDLFHSLTHNEATGMIEPFHAGSVLQAVQSVSTTFEGNQQQDAHEFLMCILDSVREACQTLNRNLLANPDLLRNSSSLVTGVSSTSALVDGLDSNSSHIAPASQHVSESKFSNTPFNPRYIFRRRKESVKSAKAAGNCKLKGVRAPSLSLTKVVSSTVPTPGVDSTPAAGGTVGDCCATLDGPGETQGTAGQRASGVSGVDERTQAQDRIVELGLNFFREDFEGVTVSRTRCLSCETVTEQKETMIDIAIPIAASEINDVAKNAQQFYQDACITEEYFRGDNKYRCETCSGYTEACRSISFEILPRLLIVQLKRFNGDMEKINSYIPTPFVLQCFCGDCLGKPEADKRHVYRLYSVITHVGARLSVGHYIAYTCSLELPQQYFNCGREQQRRCLLAPTLDGSGHGATDAAQQQHQQQQLGGSSTTAGGKGVERSNEKSTSGQLKKLFGGKKLSSAGDMSKKLKYNVISRFSPTNGVDAPPQLNGGGVGTVSAAVAGQHGCTEVGGDGRMGSASDGSSNGALPENGAAGRSPQDGGGNSFCGLPCPSSSCCGVSIKGTGRPLAATSSVLGAGATVPVVPAASLLLDGSSGATNNGSSSYNASRTNGGRAVAAPIATIHPNAHLVINHNHVLPESTNGDIGIGALPNGLLSSSSFALNSNATHSGSIANSSSTNNGNNNSVGTGLDYATQLQMKWFMCDDDKIKVMTQAEFEDMLSPRRRHVITPYLLFYARFDVQSAKTSPPLGTSQPNTATPAATSKPYASQTSSSSAGSSGTMLSSVTSTNHPSSASASGSPPTVLPDGPNSSVVTQ